MVCNKGRIQRNQNMKVKKHKYDRFKETGIKLKFI